MRSVAALGAAATVFAAAFTLCTIDRWLARHKAHELAWSQSLAMFTFASGAYWWGAATGWTIEAFRVFYLFGAILNVPYLAMGTIHLLWPGDRARTLHRRLNVVAALCAGVVIATPGKILDPDLLPVGKETFGLLPRIMAGVGSGGAATILIGGAIYSAIKLGRARTTATQQSERNHLGRLALTNTLIAMGSLVLGVGGAAFTGEDAMVAFGVFLTIGIVMLFGGFLISAPSSVNSTPTRPALASPFMMELWSLATQSNALSD